MAPYRRSLTVPGALDSAFVCARYQETVPVRHRPVMQVALLQASSPLAAAAASSGTILREGSADSRRYRGRRDRAYRSSRCGAALAVDSR